MPMETLPLTPMTKATQAGRRSLLHTASALPAMLKDSLVHAFQHDGFYLAQSAAYSAMVALFPALVFLAAMIAQLPDVGPLRYQFGDFFDQVLPSDVFPLLTAYFTDAPKAGHTARALVLSGIVSLSGASSVLTTLMEGMRRAEDLPANRWNFWQRRARALALVPLCLLPLLVSSVLVMFGQFVTSTLNGFLWPDAQPAFLKLALAARWTVALAGVVLLTALIYAAGKPQALGRRRVWVPQRLLSALPGAMMATAMWFVTTIVFGLYVTRFANYNEIYGSLGAGIALLFWLFLVFLSVLVGAEFNALWSRRHNQSRAFQSSS